MAAAHFQVGQDDQGRQQVQLFGQWSLRAMENDFAELRRALEPYFANPFASWDLRQLEQLDTAGATVLLNGWQWKVDQRILVTQQQAELFDNLNQLHRPSPGPKRNHWTQPFANVGNLVLLFAAHFMDFLQLLGLLILEVGYVLRHPGEFPWKEFLANMYKSGVTALPVTALLGCMIGIAMSFLTSTQLRTFGADIFIVNILGLAMIRELGPLLMAVLVAGRSGSAMTAQIGVMRVTEEIDALTTMGVSRILRIVLPKVLGLTLVAPLLVLWTSVWGLAGGSLAARAELGISLQFFFDYLPIAVDTSNLTLSLIKGLMFGFVVTLIACHFGLRIKPNTESLSASTTSSVVTSITSVILIDAAFAILTRGIGV